MSSGCSPESKEAKRMAEKFPDIPMHDLIRFLVARKGNFDKASDMLTKVKFIIALLKWKKLIKIFNE